MSDPAENQANTPAPVLAEEDAAERVETTVEQSPTDDAAGAATEPEVTQPEATEQSDTGPEPAPQADAQAEPAPQADTQAEPAPQADAEQTDTTQVDLAEPATEPEATAPEVPTPAEPAEATDAPAATDAAETTRPTDAAEPASPAEKASSGDPRPTPRPAPRPGPRPSAAVPRPPGPAAVSATPAAIPATDVPTPPVIDDSAAAKAAAAFGRVDADGTVYVREAAGERSVGQFPGVSEEEALALYVRRYLDLYAKVALFETRLSGTDLSIKEIDQTLARLTEETAEPSAVGDLDGLRATVESLRGAAKERRAQLEAERVAAKEAALAARTEIIEAAEKIAATDPARMQWRPAGEQLRALLERWKEAQRNGPRIDRTSEEALWKRFSHARTAFDRERRHYFAELEQRNAEAKAAKEKLVAEAEALSSSTDWGATAAAYRDLMTRWKASGRASRKDDDALWARFRAAQDRFFSARDAMNAATDAEYAANLVVKERLLEEAEALLPVTDLAAAKSALRDLQERWEEAGRVPRGDLQRVEARLRAVETAIRDADQAQWTRSNPETRARAEGAAAQLESAIDALQADLDAARDRGDARKVAELETALEARRSWLEQVVRAAEDSRG